MSYSHALETYAEIGVDTEAVLRRMAEIPLSLQCWQGDDVRGFENASTGGGGILATGSYPGRARNGDELRQDLAEAGRLIPGPKRVNLHAIYAETDQPVERTDLAVEHFQRWIDWALGQEWGIDFNPTCFAHPMSNRGFTLSSEDAGIRQFWIDHCRAARRLAAEIGKILRNPVVNNIWIPDGYKDLPYHRGKPRERLAESLDAVFAGELSCEWLVDAVESKLFGIGVESYTTGSHEFYYGYAVKNQLCLCLDSGHFHPTESVADKISAVLQFVPSILTHVSRGVRWDSDHVVILDDATKAILQAIVRDGALDKTYLGLDFFDASINRIAAWVIGARATQKALLLALLEPAAELEKRERSGDFTGRLALMEALPCLPWGEVWAEYCRRQEVPGETNWLSEVRNYENTVLRHR